MSLDDLTTEGALETLAERVVDEMQRRGLVVSEEPDRGLVSLQQLAEEEGVDPSTIYRRYIWETGLGLPKRTEEGLPKESEKRTTYLSRLEIEVGEPLDTRVVRREAGLIN
jgi:hypothetical protein